MSGKPRRYLKSKNEITEYSQLLNVKILKSAQKGTVTFRSLHIRLYDSRFKNQLALWRIITLSKIQKSSVNIREYNRATAFAEHILIIAQNLWMSKAPKDRIQSIVLVKLRPLHIITIFDFSLKVKYTGNQNMLDIHAQMMGFKRLI